MSNLTNEQIQSILDGAPEGATHVDFNRDYWDMKSEYKPLWFNVNSWQAVEGKIINARDLSDLRETLTLRQEVERLKAERDEALDGLHDAAIDHRDAKRELDILKAQQSEVAARSVEDAVEFFSPALDIDSEALKSYANQLREQSR